MNRIKAIFCTILLFIVVWAIIFAACYIELFEGYYLSRGIFSMMAGFWIADKTFDFYKWLRKDK